MRCLHKHAAFILLTLVSASTAASAQRGGGMRGQRRGESSESSPPPVSVRVAPPIAALVLEHAADLKLTDAQKTVLESVRHTQDSANRPWMQKLDSLRPTGTPANPNDLSQEQKDEIEARKIAVGNVIEGMRENNAEARKKVMDVLNPDQQVQAAVLEEDARKKLEEDTRSRQRSGSYGGGGRGGRGRPPED